MDHILVKPSGPLYGDVEINGAKNSALKLMAACSLAEGVFHLKNVPNITDVRLMSELLESLGMSVRSTEVNSLEIENPGNLLAEAPYELVEKMRASIVVLGPLLARYGQARVALPGGDDFGPRPIDMHLRGLEMLGAEFETEHGYIAGKCKRLTGNRIVLEFPSVGATGNILMASAISNGKTILKNVALEPDIVSLGEAYRKDRQSLEQQAGTLKNRFLKDGVVFIAQGISLDDLREMMATREEYRERREANEAGLMKTLGTYSPAFGMVGTLIGLVFMLFNMGGDPSAMGPAMAVALVTTFYGSVLANLVFIPFSFKVFKLPPFFKFSSWFTFIF